MTNAPVTGVLLAGGQSRRMGGGDKGLLALAGKSMLRHVIDRCGRRSARSCINANGDPARFAGFGLPVVPTPFGFVGPLAGVLAGMRWSAAEAPQRPGWSPPPATRRSCPAIWSIGCGPPSTAAPDGIALARSSGELHPVIGLWPVALAEDLEAAAPQGRAQGPALVRAPRLRGRGLSSRAP